MDIIALNHTAIAGHDHIDSGPRNACVSDIFGFNVDGEELVVPAIELPHHTHMEVLGNV